MQRQSNGSRAASLTGVASARGVALRQAERGGGGRGHTGGSGPDGSAGNKAGESDAATAVPRLLGYATCGMFVPCMMLQVTKTLLGRDVGSGRLELYC
eukprot:351149-Chlamydomonas_euryale.AAC.3